MRIEQSGTTTVALAAAADDVLAVVADRDEVSNFVAPLLDDASTPERWVVEPVRIGPVTVRPVTRPTVTRDGDVVTVAGEPVAGATPTWLVVRMAVRSDDDTCRMAVDWEVRVDLPGPQLVARLARPMLRAEARQVTHDLSARLVARFADR